MIHPITFKSSPDTLSLQVQQVMRENRKAYEQEIVDNCTKRIEDKYLQDFNIKIKDAENNLSKKDFLNILNTIKSAYADAGRSEDSKVIAEQIKRLDKEV